MPQISINGILVNAKSIKRTKKLKMYTYQLPNSLLDSIYPYGVYNTEWELSCIFTSYADAENFIESLKSGAVNSLTDENGNNFSVATKYARIKEYAGKVGYIEVEVSFIDYSFPSYNVALVTKASVISMLPLVAPFGTAGKLRSQITTITLPNAIVRAFLLPSLGNVLIKVSAVATRSLGNATINASAIVSLANVLNTLGKLTSQISVQLITPILVSLGTAGKLVSTIRVISPQLISLSTASKLTSSINIVSLGALMFSTAQKLSSSISLIMASKAFVSATISAISSLITSNQQIVQNTITVSPTKLIIQTYQLIDTAGKLVSSLTITTLLKINPQASVLTSATSVIASAQAFAQGAISVSMTKIIITTFARFGSAGKLSSSLTLTKPHTDYPHNDYNHSDANHLDYPHNDFNHADGLQHNDHVDSLSHNDHADSNPHADLTTRLVHDDGTTHSDSHSDTLVHNDSHGDTHVHSDDKHTDFNHADSTHNDYNHADYTHGDF